MKIIEPSAEIIEQELAELSVCQRIDRCASVCYQRNPKPTEDEAQAFCRSLIERGHLPALEFAVVHLALPRKYAEEFGVCKYLRGEYSLSGYFIVSGSIRAFMEACVDGAMTAFLAHYFPAFFQSEGPDEFNGTDFVSDVDFATQEEIPWQHRHVAVRVICSRAISHELVRHRPCSFLQESQRFCKYNESITFIHPKWATETLLMDKYFEEQCWLIESMYKSRSRLGLSPQQARGILSNDTKTELIIYASLLEWKHIFKMRCSKAADPEMQRIMIPLREQFQAEYPEMWEMEK